MEEAGAEPSRGAIHGLVLTEKPGAWLCAEPLLEGDVKRVKTSIPSVKTTRTLRAWFRAKGAASRERQVKKKPGTP